MRKKNSPSVDVMHFPKSFLFLFFLPFFNYDISVEIKKELHIH